MTSADALAVALRAVIEEHVGSIEAERREPWVSPEIAAQHAACSPDSLRRAAREGRLAHGKVGAEYRYRLSDVDAWMVAEAARAPEPRRPRAVQPQRSARTAEILADLDARKSA